MQSVYSKGQWVKVHAHIDGDLTFLAKIHGFTKSKVKIERWRLSRKKKDVENPEERYVEMEVQQKDPHLIDSVEEPPTCGEEGCDRGDVYLSMDYDGWRCLAHGQGILDEWCEPKE
jgi:hypothetical protein